MPRVTSKTNRPRISVYDPKGKKHTPSSGSMLVLACTKTRRGKTIYTEVDPALLSDEGGQSSKRKPSMTPPHSTETVPAPLEDTFQWDATLLDGQEPHERRVTKVRL